MQHDGRDARRTLHGADRAVDAMTPLAVLLVLLIGTSLGLVGCGGSILTVSALAQPAAFVPGDAMATGCAPSLALALPLRDEARAAPLLPLA